MHFFSFYHWISRKNPSIPQDESVWPRAWTTVEQKVYENARLHALPQNEHESPIFEQNLERLLKTRKSRRNFSESQSVNKKQLGCLLQFSCGESADATKKNPRRTYPSAGARYPIEVYIYLRKSCEDIPPGIHHYRSDLHALEEVHVFHEGDDHPKFFGYTWTYDAFGALFLTGIFERSAMKYSERSYRCTLLEAGHIGQNMYLVGEALNLKVTALSGTRDELIEQYLGIDGYTESLVYTLVFG